MTEYTPQVAETLEDFWRLSATAGSYCRLGLYVTEGEQTGD